ncbi:putative iron-regulated membrane protein [Defluviimonas denitrificans]|jgi:uncharacterized iron-regulated membrane protein|uniref:Putative iron-regulated membrane protein n=1 Tax=Albidovulum denitrificans TaxID=404881 RepID=A0A2S8RWJ3_9RHOB|nr:PepSY-associated TM helix domain-containing protein [Defluviimonas denitrificans]PQV52857.1 putative iron-regulated membrane protein [Defluviimonas denitrificans]
MTFRKSLFWVHLVAGVSAGIFILLMSITGALLTYEVQILRWADSYDVTASGAPLPAERLAEIADAETEGKAGALVFTNDPATAVLATSGREGKLYLDPYTGEALGAGSEGAASFFQSVTTLHRWLSLSGSTEIGGTLVSLSNLVFLLLLVTGVYLWLPRIWKWGMLKTKILFRRSYPNAKARDFAWHHVFAFWAIIPLFVIVVSGVVISYPWASNALYAIYGEEAPAGRGRPGGAAGSGALAVSEGGVGLQGALETAMAHDPDWNRITLTLPRGQSSDTITAMVDTGSGRQPAKQETLRISQDNGTVTSVSSIDDQTPATRARIWMRFVHTGEVYGLIGQTLAGLTSLAAAISVYTGLALSYRRLIVPLLRRRRAA